MYHASEVNRPHKRGSVMCAKASIMWFNNSSWVLNFTAYTKDFRYPQRWLSKGFWSGDLSGQETGPCHLIQWS